MAHHFFLLLTLVSYFSCVISMEICTLTGVVDLGKTISINTKTYQPGKVTEREEDKLRFFSGIRVAIPEAGSFELSSKDRTDMEMVAFRFAFLLLSVITVKADGECDFREPVDLGRTVSRSTISVTQPYVPGNITEGRTLDTTFRINDFCIGEHAGTHLDSPYHFYEQGWTVAEIPLERLLANGVLINVTEEAAGNTSFRLEPRHIDEWVTLNGAFPDNAILLINYGWAQLYQNRSAYLGTTPEHFNDFTAYHYPGMSVDTARKLSEIEQLVGVGVDTPSIDPSGSGQSHVILAAKNVYNLEHVNLAAHCLPARGFKVLSLPMKLERGTGAPARVIATP